jgi:hypothetical protein
MLHSILNSFLRCIKQLSCKLKDFGVSPTFNISDLKPYMGEEDEIESRTTPIQEGEDDEDITSIPYNIWADNTIVCTTAIYPATLYPSQLCFRAYARGHGCFDD